MACQSAGRTTDYGGWPWRLGSGIPDKLLQMPLPLIEWQESPRPEKEKKVEQLCEDGTMRVRGEQPGAAHAPRMQRNIRKFRGLHWPSSVPQPQTEEIEAAVAPATHKRITKWKAEDQKPKKIRKRYPKLFHKSEKSEQSPCPQLGTPVQPPRKRFDDVYQRPVRHISRKEPKETARVGCGECERETVIVDSVSAGWSPNPRGWVVPGPAASVAGADS